MNGALLGLGFLIILIGGGVMYYWKTRNDDNTKASTTTTPKAEYFHYYADTTTDPKKTCDTKACKDKRRPFLIIGSICLGLGTIMLLAGVAMGGKKQ